VIADKYDFAQFIILINLISYIERQRL
jgi:hypothetical protein